MFPGSTDDPDQYSAMCQFYFATGGPVSWKVNTNWLAYGKSYCEWYGVTCSDNATENIYDPENGLTGNLIVELDLHDNGLTGSIPESFGQLRGLKEVYLQHNRLSGPVPNSLGEAWKMNILHLEYNNFTGNLPQSLGQMRFLTQFYFHHNDITGNLPDSLSGMRQLLVLDGNHNQLTGSIPYTFQFMGNLTYLDFSFNLLQGNIPYFLNHLVYLKVIRLSDNQFSRVDLTLTQSAIISCDFSRNPLSCPVPSWTTKLCGATCQ